MKKSWTRMPRSTSSTPSRIFPPKRSLSWSFTSRPNSQRAKGQKPLPRRSTTISGTGPWWRSGISAAISGTGGVSLIIGLTFLAVALVARQMVSHASTLFLTQFFADALLIIGWVAMWEPITVLLYQLWPITQTKKIYEKLSTIEIDVLPSVTKPCQVCGAF